MKRTVITIERREPSAPPTWGQRLRDLAAWLVFGLIMSFALAYLASAAVVAVACFTGSAEWYYALHLPFAAWLTWKSACIPRGADL